MAPSSYSRKRKLTTTQRTRRAKLSQGRPPSTWPNFELGVRLARKTSVQTASKSPTILGGLVRKRLTSKPHWSVDSVGKNWKRHRWAMSRLSKTFAENQTASSWWNRVVLKSCHAGIHAKDSEARLSVLAVSMKHAFRNTTWPFRKKSDLNRCTKMSIVESANSQDLEMSLLLC